MPTDLDAVRWIGPGYPRKREAAEAVAAAERSARGNTWIIEGVHGWLADVALSHDTCMIWLDRPVESCIANLTERDLRGGGDRVAFSALLERAGDYRETRRQFSTRSAR